MENLQLITHEELQGLSSKDTKNKKISYRLSYLLRHGKEKDISPLVHYHGIFFELNDLFLRKIGVESLDEVIYIVKTNKKRRFAMYKHLTSGTYWIVATQGHSNITPERRTIIENYLLHRVEEHELPIYLFHGTTTANETSILEQGLKNMGRLHVHLFGPNPQMPTEPNYQAVSGIRANSQVILRVKARDFYINEHPVFYQSQNGVYLTEGPIAPVYIEKMKK